MSVACAAPAVGVATKVIKYIEFSYKGVDTLDITIRSPYIKCNMGKMIDTTEAARHLGVGALRVQQLCRQRRIKGARLSGRVWMIPEDFVVKPGTRGPKPRK
jgi:hypothetical protein